MVKRFAALLMVTLPMAAYAQSLPERNIESVSFDSVTVGDAVGKLLAGTDIKVNSKNAPIKKVSAINVSGDLKEVLDNFASTVGFTYEYDNNVITIIKKPDLIVQKQADVTTSAPSKVTHQATVADKAIAQTSTPVTAVVTATKPTVTPVHGAPVVTDSVEVASIESLAPAIDYTLVVKQGQIAPYVLKDYLAHFNYKLFWSADPDLMVGNDIVIKGKSAKDVADGLLKQLNLHGWIVQGEDTLFVR